MKRILLIAAALAYMTGAAFALPAIPAMAGGAKIVIGAAAATVGAVATNYLPKILGSSGTGEDTKYDVLKTRVSIEDMGVQRNLDIRAPVTLKQIVSRIVRDTGGDKLPRAGVVAALTTAGIPQDRAQQIASEVPTTADPNAVPRDRNPATGKPYAAGDSASLWFAPFRNRYGDTPEAACGGPARSWGDGYECLDARGEGTRIFPYRKSVAIVESAGDLCSSRVDGASIMCGTVAASPTEDVKDAVVASLTEEDIRAIIGAMRAEGLLQAQPVSTTLPSGRTLTIGPNGEVLVGDKPATEEEIKDASKEATAATEVAGESVDTEVDIDIPTEEAQYTHREYITINADACLPPIGFDALGQRFEIPLTEMCNALSVVGTAIVAAAAFISMRILVS